jgi:zinc transport system substrate-binding protein
MNKRQLIFVIIIISIILVAIFATFLFSSSQEETDDKVKIVATFYPLTFFARKIGGELVFVDQLIPDNTEVHEWQPSPSDILAVEQADLILFNGASLDHWFEEDLLSIIDISDKVVVETTEDISLLGIENEDEHEHNHDGEFDPHTWLSPYIAKLQAQNIYEALMQVDPDQTEYYTENWVVLKAKFEELDNNFLAELSNKVREEIFVTHSAYGYVADRYGFEQHGVIGISADEQPSISTYEMLVEMMLENQVHVIYVDPVYSDESAQTIKNELARLSGQNVQILKLYLMLGNFEGLDYFGQQEQNLGNLKIGLVQ